MDCVPHDPSMIDNVHGGLCKADPSTSHEKDDEDDYYSTTCKYW